MFKRLGCACGEKRKIIGELTVNFYDRNKKQEEKTYRSFVQPMRKLCPVECGIVEVYMTNGRNSEWLDSRFVYITYRQVTVIATRNRW